MLFSRHGMPEIVISDNAPRHACTEFATFASEWHLKHRDNFIPVESLG